LKTKRRAGDGSPFSFLRSPFIGAGVAIRIKDSPTLEHPRTKPPESEKREENLQIPTNPIPTHALPLKGRV